VNLIAIETSGDFCSIAVSNAGRVYARHVQAGQRQAELSLGLIDDLLRQAGLAFGDVQGIAYGEGPGAFTGLRIACSIVQGLALARDLPVAGVGTLEALAQASGEAAVIACMDARMGEVYHAAYRRMAAGLVEVTAPGLCRPEAVPAPQGEDWIGCGSGFAAYGEALASACAGRLREVRPAVAPTAVAVLELARPRFAGESGWPAVGDGASAVPIYLRDKVALKTSERR
jgi:tRNA threonylcarbamoyladenosine biosynthesis protein TsaB